MFDYTVHDCDHSPYFQRELSNLKMPTKAMKVIITFQGHSQEVINEKKDAKSEANKELCLLRVCLVNS
jgi:hypothetical protein